MRGKSVQTFFLNIYGEKRETWWLVEVNVQDFEKLTTFQYSNDLLRVPQFQFFFCLFIWGLPHYVASYGIMWNLDHLLYAIEYRTTICTKEVMATAYANYSVLYPISAIHSLRFLITELVVERTVELIPAFFPSL